MSSAHPQLSHASFRPVRLLAATAATGATLVGGAVLAAPANAAITPVAAVSGVADVSSSSAVSVASSYVGVRYVYGGASPSGFDCSGFTQYVFSQLGINLPRTAAAQYGAVSHVSQGAKQPGDLLFFSDGGGIYHVAIYAGGDSMYDAPHSGTTVGLRGIWSGSYLVGRVGGVGSAPVALSSTDTQASTSGIAVGGGLLSFGSTGSSVSAVQSKLGDVAVDGVFGQQTRGAVITFQQDHGLLVDGIVGPQTRGALGL